MIRRLLLILFLLAAPVWADSGPSFFNLDISDLVTPCKPARIYGIKDGSNASDCSVAGGSVAVGCMCDQDGLGFTAYALSSSLFSPTDIDTDYGNETVTSDWIFRGAGSTGAHGAYDLVLGDTYAGLGFGNVGIYSSSFSASNLDLDKAVLFRQEGAIGAGNDPGIEFAWMEQGNTVRMAIPESGADNATAFIRSGTFAGPYSSGVGNDIVSCDQWTAFNTNIDCDTAGTGADLFVQDDLEVEGTIFLHETLNFEGATADGNQVILQVGADPGADVTLTLPTVTSTLGVCGNTTEFQYNDSDACGASSTLAFDPASNEVVFAQSFATGGPVDQLQFRLTGQASPQSFDLFRIEHQDATELVVVEGSGDMFIDSVIGLGSTTLASAACIANDASDRLFHDTDCDETKDGGEEYIDLGAAPAAHAASHEELGSDEVAVTSDMMNEDFGHFTCDGTTGNCTLDNLVVDSPEINTGAVTQNKLGGDAVSVGKLDDGVSISTDGDFVITAAGGVEFDYLTPHAGTDVSADLEEETHASEMEDGGADEIAVTGGMMNADFGDFTCDGTATGCTSDNAQYEVYSSNAGNMANTNWTLSGLGNPAGANDSGSNTQQRYAAYDPTTDECGYLMSIAGTNNLRSGASAQFIVRWYIASTEVVGRVVRWDIRHLAVADGESWDQAYSTLGATSDEPANLVDRVERTFFSDTYTNLGWTAADMIYLFLCRDANHAADSLGQDALVTSVQVRLSVNR